MEAGGAGGAGGVGSNGTSGGGGGGVGAEGKNLLKNVLNKHFSIDQEEIVLQDPSGRWRAVGGYFMRDPYYIGNPDTLPHCDRWKVRSLFNTLF